MKIELLKRLILGCLLVWVMLGLVGCGDSGVDNGVITGTIYSNRSGGAATKTPEPNVSILAVYQDEPQVIRNTTSDENGQYTLPNLLIGSWALGFSKDGFVTITAAEKQDETTGAESAIGGENIKLYVENGSTSPAPDITLQQKPPEGDATVIVNLIDNTTGERINGATVTVGTATSSNSSNGQYVLVVPVIASESSNTAQNPQQFVVAAEGYTGVAAGSDGVEGNLNVLPGQTVEYVVSMEPRTGFLEGQLEMAKFDTLYDVQSFNVSVDGLSQENAVQIQNDGSFRVAVPVRTSTNNRSYTLRVTGRGIFDAVVNNILGPQAGSVRVEVPKLSPETVTIVGRISRPNTGFPVVVNGLGLEGGVTGGAVNCANNTAGSYSIDGVPTNTEQPLELVATVFTCDEAGVVQDPEVEARSGTFTATNNGSGVYSAPTITGSGGE